MALGDEFPSAPLAWRQRGRTVHLTTAADVAAHDGDILAALDATLAEHPTAKALLLSAASYMDGHTADLVRAGELCGARGVDLVVDGCSALGAMPLDLGAANVAFLAGGSYKFLCAGPGLGVLYVARRVLERVGTPPGAGWFSQQHGAGGMCGARPCLSPRALQLDFDTRRLTGDSHRCLLSLTCAGRRADAVRRRASFPVRHAAPDAHRGIRRGAAPHRGDGRRHRCRRA